MLQSVILRSISIALLVSVTVTLQDSSRTGHPSTIMQPYPGPVYLEFGDILNVTCSLSYKNPGQPYMLSLLKILSDNSTVLLANDLQDPSRSYNFFINYVVGPFTEFDAGKYICQLSLKAAFLDSKSIFAYLKERPNLTMIPSSATVEVERGKSFQTECVAEPVREGYKLQLVEKSRMGFVLDEVKVKQNENRLRIKYSIPEVERRHSGNVFACELLKGDIIQDTKNITLIMKEERVTPQIIGKRADITVSPPSPITVQLVVAFHLIGLEDTVPRFVCIMRNAVPGYMMEITRMSYADLSQKWIVLKSEMVTEASISPRNTSRIEYIEKNVLQFFSETYRCRAYRPPNNDDMVVSKDFTWASSKVNSS